MNFFDVVKAVVDIVVGVGSGVIVGYYTGDAVKGAKGITKACATVAAVAIEGLVASKASTYLNDQIDEISNGIEEFKNKRKKEEE